MCSRPFKYIVLSHRKLDTSTICNKTLTTHHNWGHVHQQMCSKDSKLTATTRGLHSESKKYS